jgi:hypothetical protein
VPDTPRSELRRQWASAPLEALHVAIAERDEARDEVERLQQRERDLTSEAIGLHEALRKETAEVERLRGQAQAEATSGQIHYERRRELEAEVERLREALQRIERLKDRWSAPISHPVGDTSDPAYAGAAAWAAVGSEAHKIASVALSRSESP